MYYSVAMPAPQEMEKIKHEAAAAAIESRKAVDEIELAVAEQRQKESQEAVDQLETVMDEQEKVPSASPCFTTPSQTRSHLCDGDTGPTRGENRHQPGVP